MASFGLLAHLRPQFAHLGSFAPAFAYLDAFFQPGSAALERVRALDVGGNNRIELGGGAFALEQIVRTKGRSEGFFESHRKFIDIQVVLEGEEWMEVADTASMTVERPYDPERDFVVYRDTAAISALRVGVGEAAVFFPTDAHMSVLCGKTGPAVVRKIVVKVPVANGA